MDNNKVFAKGLGLSEPWQVQDVDFSGEPPQLHIRLDFPRGSRFACPQCQKAGCPVHDSIERTWRHLDFFQHQAFLQVRMPRVNCDKCGVHQAAAPWARPGSGFTLLFESLVVTLARCMPVANAAELLREHDTRLWRLLIALITLAREQQKYTEVKRIGIDETARSRGHAYVTVVKDLDKDQVIFVCPGKDAATVKQFTEDFNQHDGKIQKITDVTCDMSPAYISGVSEYLPNAEITFDKFHVIKMALDAIKRTRLDEQKHQSPDLRKYMKSAHWAILTNPDNQTKDQRIMNAVLAMPEFNLKTAKAVRMKLTLQDVYSLKGDEGTEKLRSWCNWAVRARVPEMGKVAKTIRKHWDGVTKYFTSGLTNAKLEGGNGQFQAARARARGYRNVEYYIAMIFLIGGRLGIPVTHTR